VASPEGMFRDGVLQPSFTAPLLPRLCRKRFPEYSQRQSIKGMFARMSSTRKRSSSDVEDKRPTSIKNLINPLEEEENSMAPPSKRAKKTANPPKTAKPKAPAPKTAKTKAQPTKNGKKPQPSIRGFMQPPVASEVGTGSAASTDQQYAAPTEYTPSTQYSPIAPAPPQYKTPSERRSAERPYKLPHDHSSSSTQRSDSPNGPTLAAPSSAYAVYTPDPNSDSYIGHTQSAQRNVPAKASAATGGTQSTSSPPVDSPERIAVSDFVDPVDSMQKWKAIFKKKPPPVCDMHSEECIQRVSKKAGSNTGRAFWVCCRYLSLNLAIPVRCILTKLPKTYRPRRRICSEIGSKERMAVQLLQVARARRLASSEQTPYIEWIADVV